MWWVTHKIYNFVFYIFNFNSLRPWKPTESMMNSNDLHFNDQIFNFQTNNADEDELENDAWDPC